MGLFELHSADAEAEPELFVTRVAGETEEGVERLLVTPGELAVCGEEIIADCVARDMNRRESRIGLDYVSPNKDFTLSVSLGLCGIASSCLINIGAL